MTFSVWYVAASGRGIAVRVVHFFYHLLADFCLSVIPVIVTDLILSSEIFLVITLALGSWFCFWRGRTTEKARLLLLFYFGALSLCLSLLCITATFDIEFLKPSSDIVIFLINTIIVSV